ncbi:hypothetical protein BJ878DRAFT_252728 [Calycina marina]|uniref:Peptide hydrolase n=1 Tax=Calycina marina TaxID=1763456 RepID=A0A9P7Z7H2_9HELO|nr:hypothetical protein BJ878DRAFT_252728 [Calycina marina]
MKLAQLSLVLLLANWVSASIPNIPQQPLLSASTTSLLALHKDLVEIESITGNEADVAAYLVTYLQKQNFTVETQEVVPESKGQKARHNVLAYAGKQRKTRVLISSHIDTVPPYWPYERKGDEIWGRGSVDAKGSVATQIIAVEQLLEAGKLEEGDIALLFVVGEEVDGVGMKKFNELGLSWETVIFGEPTELKLASGHKGIMGVEIHAKGKAGHSGYPKLGKSANAMIIRALAALLDAKLPYSEKYGNSTLNIGTIQGGVAANVIPEDAISKIAIRIADGTPEEVKKICSDAIKSTGEELDINIAYGYGPIYIDSDVEGFDTIVCNYGTDIPNLEGHHKRYLYGAGSILMAHSDHEHLKISDLETAVEGYKKLISHALK